MCIDTLYADTYSQTGSLMDETGGQSTFIVPGSCRQSGSNPGSATYSFVTLGRLLSLSVPQFLHLYFVGNDYA